jgi:hypothetical protein
MVASLRDTAVMANLAVSGIDTFTYKTRDGMLFEEPFVTDQTAPDDSEGAASRGSM